MTQCPVCGRVLPTTEMKCNGRDNGESFESWVCDGCGLRFVVSWKENQLSEERDVNTMVTNILFVCHGNICRSPMAEFVMKDLVSKNGLSDSFHIESCATSTEEIGCDIYPPVRQELEKRGIPYEHRHARQMTSSDYNRFDLIIAMDHQNLRNLKRFVGDDKDRKVSLLLSYIGKGDLADPWYTGSFDRTFEDVSAACLALLKRIV